MRYTHFEIEEHLYGGNIHVTAHISHDGMRDPGEDGTKPPPPPPGWAMLGGPVIYVAEPNILERAIGITLEAKLNRARAGVSAWARREIERQNRLQDALEARIEARSA